MFSGQTSSSKNLKLYTSIFWNREVVPPQVQCLGEQPFVFEAAAFGFAPKSIFK